MAALRWRARGSDICCLNTSRAQQHKNFSRRATCTLASRASCGLRPPRGRFERADKGEEDDEEGDDDLMAILRQETLYGMD